MTWQERACPQIGLGTGIELDAFRRMLLHYAVYSTALAFAAGLFNCTIVLEEPTYVLLPDTTGHTHIVDQSLLVANVSLGTTTILRGYSAWLRTQLIINGSSLNALVPNMQWPPNVTESWDLEGAVQDVTTGIFHGLMHREHGWMRNGTYKYYGSLHGYCALDDTSQALAFFSPRRLRNVRPQHRSRSVV